MPAVETVGAVVETLNLTLELFKVIRAGIFQPWSKDNFKILSSLTTLEFKYEDGKQIAHFVQDRRVLFTKKGGQLPPFNYATDGEDAIEELLIDDMPQPFKITESDGNPANILPSNPLTYEKNDLKNMTLIARSVDGFTKEQETYRLRVVRWIGRSQIAVIFPKDKKPVGYDAYYEQKQGSSVVMRHLKYKTWSLRKTTFDKWVLYLELNNISVEKTYVLEWTWPS